MFCIQRAQMQNVLHFGAPDQNPLDLTGFCVVGSSRTRVSLHSSFESAQAHRTSNAKDFPFVAHRMKGSYDERAVGDEGRRPRRAAGHEAWQSGISGFESAHEPGHKPRTGVGARTQEPAHWSRARTQESAHRSRHMHTRSKIF
jgi:hypothetical protein